MAHEVFAEAVVGFFADEAKAGGLIEAMGGGEDALGPEGDALVSGGAGEADTLVDEAGADAEAAGGGIDVEEAEFGGAGLLGVADEEDVAEVDAVALGDPAALAGFVVVGEEVGGDAGDEPFEGVVPSKLLDVAGAFKVDDHAHVAGAVGAEDDEIRTGTRDQGPGTRARRCGRLRD